MLVAIGYDPALTSDMVQVTTRSGVELAARDIPMADHRARAMSVPVSQRWATRGRPAHEWMVCWAVTVFRNLKLTIDSRFGRGRPTSLTNPLGGDSSSRRSPPMRAVAGPLKV